MPRFQYKARNWEGKMITNEMEGDSKEFVISKLRERNYFVTQITEKKKARSFFAKRVKTAEVSIFARQFSTMISAGVPLVKCLTILEEQQENPAFKEILNKIKADVEAGLPLSKALGAYPKTFSTLFVDLVKAGEAGGILDDILDRLANYLENSEQLKAKVKGALTYPVVVAGIACLVVLFLLTFVLPNFKQIFDGMENIELPLPTKVLLAVSEFLETYIIIFVGFVIGGFFLLKKFFETKQGIRIFDANSLRIPVVGLMLRKVAVAKFTRTLGTLITSGVPILQALEITSTTSGNVIISDAIQKTRVSIKEGESIADPLKTSGVFPPMVVQMIAVGEQTGELDGMLIKIADFYDQEVDTAVKGLTSVIEPVIIVFMGLVIGGIVMAIFMPMLEMVNGVQ